jgi:GT2 family glycosyltransferase
MEVDSVVGAFLLIRKSLINKIGLLDESFFMYGEDLDWCWRCKEAGFKVLYYPRTFIYHYKGQSSKKAPFRMLKAFHGAMWIFYKKHYADRHFFLFNLLVYSGIYLRLGVLVFINLFKTDPTVSK